MKRSLLFITLTLLCLSCSRQDDSGLSTDSKDIMGDSYDVNWSPFLMVIPGECYSSPEPQVTEQIKQARTFYTLIQNVFSTATGAVWVDFYPDLHEGNLSEGNLRKISSIVLDSESFWLPDTYSEKKASELCLEFYNTFEPIFEDFCKENNYNYTSSSSSLWCTSILLECQGETKVYSSQNVFGTEAGNNLILHFKCYRTGYGRAIIDGYHPFLIKKGNNSPNLPLSTFFCKGEMMPYDGFLIFTEEPFDGPVDITIEIPVKKVMYLSYLRDLKRDPNAELQLVPMTLHAEFTLNNLN